MYTAAVLDSFLDEKIEFDGIIGVSAGALFGVNYLSKQKGRVIRYNCRFNSDKNYMGLIPFFKEGNIVSTDYAYRKVPYELDPFDNETYMASKVPYYAVVTNVKTGLPGYIKIDDVYKQMDTLRASGSLPIVSRKVLIDKEYYLDGGISDSIPFKWMRDKGYKKLVVILTQDADYVKKPFSKVCAALTLSGMPKIKERMLARHEVYNNLVNELKDLETSGDVMVIRPSKRITIGKLEKDPEKLRGVYELGLSDCAKQMASLKEFLNTENP